MADRFRLNPVGTGQTLTDRVYLTVKEAILDLKFRPGSPLVEDDLARQLGTSKTPVRDALLALERDGLVTKIAYKGTYVSEVSLKDATEIFELRAVLEGLAARLATPALTAQDLAEAGRLLDAADEARERGDAEAASTYGARFHQLMHENADNGRLKPILEKLEEQLRRLRRLSDLVAGRLEKSAYEHRQILAALHNRDGLRAEAAMRQHLESVVADFSLAMDDESAASRPADGRVSAQEAAL
jgi:DNA-binding GntR family transcriptional regulator